MIAFGVDVAMTGLGVWKGGEASKYLFLLSQKKLAELFG